MPKPDGSGGQVRLTMRADITKTKRFFRRLQKLCKKYGYTIGVKNPRRSPEMKNPYKKIVAVDFDGTLCKDAYPNIGEPLPYSLYYIKELAKDGAILILHTCRSGALLDAAVAWCNERGVVFDYINENVPENIDRYGGDTRKIYADIYVDTNAVNPRRLFGIGEFDENIGIFEFADKIARRELCETKCLCPDIRAAGKCCNCDVFFTYRQYHALRTIENAEAAKSEPPTSAAGGT